MGPLNIGHMGARLCPLFRSSFGTLRCTCPFVERLFLLLCPLRNSRMAIQFGCQESVYNINNASSTTHYIIQLLVHDLSHQTDITCVI